jgi:hypothetical protein
MQNNDYQKKGIVYREIQDEKAKRRGTGFLGFISDLDWLLSLELEEGRPLDATKITTGQKVYIFEIGFILGFGVHGAVLFGLTVAFWLFLYGTQNAPVWISHLGYGVVLLFSLLIKLAIPLWFLETYYLYPRGVIYTYLLWFLWGYAFGLFLPDLGMLLIFLFVKGGLFLVEGTDFYKRIYPYIEKYAPQFTSWWWFIIEFILSFFSFAPPFLLYFWRKLKPLGKYPWLPLDFIPDENSEKELEELLKKYQK